MSYNSKNLNYAFNVEYYSKSPDEANRDIAAIEIPVVERHETEQCFELQTCYPGLLIGIGNFHGAGEKGELDGGFSLDYVTGAPYIPASSLKGVLRSAFKHEEYIRDVLGDNSIDVKALEKEIFDGERDGKEIPMYDRDVFFDAYPQTPGRIMGIESITPHDGEFKSPNPLSFLKVLPRVVFKFCFNLHESEVCKAVTADEKLRLFKAIIKDFGMGAKTNVGFGAFEDKNDQKKFEESSRRPLPAKAEKKEFREKGEVTRIVCKACGAPNFKYIPNTQEIRWNWEKNSCHKCHKEFR